MSHDHDHHGAVIEIIDGMKEQLLISESMSKILRLVVLKLLKDGQSVEVELDKELVKMFGNTMTSVTVTRNGAKLDIEQS